MRSLVRILAVIVALAAVAFWAATGANRGWTKTSVPVKKLDEITGIEAMCPAWTSSAPPDLAPWC